MVGLVFISNKVPSLISFSKNSLVTSPIPIPDLINSVTKE